MSAGDVAGGDVAAIRAALAAAALDLVDAAPPPATIGPVTLRPHQRLAVVRLRRALATHRGALLADAVGLGKTWVALALLADLRCRAPSGSTAPLLVVAPAVLRTMWRAAAAAADVPVTFCSTESLSAPQTPPLPPRPALVVVDEAHHFRTRGTRRRRRLAPVCARSRTLLLTATPLHNGAGDLVALLALFLGERAHTLDAPTLAALVVRRRHTDLRRIATPVNADARSPTVPHVARTRWHHLPAAAGVRRALLALPPPLPAAGGTPAPALATLTLVRLWSSSDAALRAALRRRLVRATALAHALADGRHPDRRTLARWAAHDDALQLPLFAEGVVTSHGDTLAAHVAAHAAAVRRTAALLETAPPADPARVAWLRAVRDAHPGARVVAFTQFADTARALFRALALDGHVGLLTATGGRIASGPLAREALLARFTTPAGDVPAIERVDLLVATDCLSEGLDLRSASVVVHLDVPWTPARLAQRVGRAARLGASHDTVHVHGLRPDPHTARWMRLARRLRAKARAARRTLGATARGGPVARHLAVLRACERWLTTDLVRAAWPADARPRAGVVTAVRCGHTGFVAVHARPGTGPVADRPAPTLVAALDGRPPTAAPGAVARALRALGAPHVAAVPAPAPLAADARRAVARWARRRTAVAAVGRTRPAPLAPSATRALVHGAGSAAVRAALARADGALRTAPPQARAARADAVARLRDALVRSLGAGAEQALASVAHLADDGVWLAAAAAALHEACAPTADAFADTSGGPDMRGGGPHLVALVLLLP